MYSQTELLSDSSSESSERKSYLRRVRAAAFAGSLVEFYDLQIYSTAAALVFAHVFFPQLGKMAGTVVAFGTIGVAFVARPLGSILLGHLGDRLGRKQTLVITLVAMGLSTVLVGLLPTSNQIGIASPILLILLRVIQGFAAGGEFAGGALLVVENAPAEKRGAWAAVPMLGGAASTSLAGLTFLITSATMSDETFRAWGWRLPFLLSAVLLAVGLYIRVSMCETPVFAKEVHRRGASRVPILEAFKKQPRDMLLASLVEVPALALLYLVATFLVNYGVNQLRLGYSEVLWVTVTSGLLMLIGIWIGATLSDRVGRRPVLILSTGLSTVWALVLFPVLYIGTLASYAAVVIVTMLLSGLIVGPVGAFMSELFHTRYRYTAVGLCYNVAGILGGGLVPVIAAPIVSEYGNLAFGKVLAAICFVSFSCCLAIRETRRVALDTP